MYKNIFLLAAIFVSCAGSASCATYTKFIDDEVSTADVWISAGLPGSTLYSEHTIFPQVPGRPVLLADNRESISAPQLSYSQEPAVLTTPLQSSPSPYQGSQPLQISQAQDEIRYNTIDTGTSGVPEYLKDYIVKVGASFPIYDDDFKDFIDNGLSISLGVEKRVTPKISLVGEIEFVMMRGDWSVGGSKAALEIAAEEWVYSGNPNIGFSSPNEIYPEENEENLGGGYWVGGETTTVSAESLKKIDIETTMLMLPVSVNTYYWPLQGKKFNPYLGGGIGICLAQRYADSNAIKEKYFEGPEYLITLNDSEFNHGLFLQMFAGVHYPLRNNVIFIVQGKTAFYNMKNFDPVFTVSFKDETRTLENPSIVTYSYEEPREVGIIEDVFISSFTVGLVIPF